jgi:hypothetical protein
MSDSLNSGWHMTSIPLIPEDNSIESVYGDDAASGYFLFNYTQIAGYNLIGSVNHGAGYWLALEDSIFVDIDGVAGYDIDSLALNDGWNIIGGALPIPVPITTLEFTDGVTTRTYSQAVNTNWISPSVFGYNNSSGGYELAHFLESWRGYWLQTIISGLEMITSPPGPGGWNGFDRLGELDNEEEWYVTIEVMQGDLSSCLARIGIHPDATDGYDRWFDLPAPPLPPGADYTQIKFPHREWGVPAGDIFCHDIRAPFTASNSQTWEGLIEAPEQGDIRIDFGDIAQILPDGYHVSAEFDNEILDLISTPEITLQYTEPCQIIITVFNTPKNICYLRFH